MLLPLLIEHATQFTLLKQYTRIKMGYQTTTIAETLNRINNDLFIPAIQRPFVWLPEDITRLFDSLMRGYPIGGFMFWDLPEGSFEDWEIYYFVKYFRMGSIHNEQAELSPGHPVTLVLDGQQRLTSLLIGLRGSTKTKQSLRDLKGTEVNLRMHVVVFAVVHIARAFTDRVAPGVSRLIRSVSVAGSQYS